MSRYHLLAIFLSLGLLSGCQDKTSDTYLLTHPDTLQTQVTACQRMSQKSNDDIARCQRVMQAADTFTALATELQASPERFGQTIMAAERQCAHLKAEWLVASHNLHHIKEADVSADVVQAASTKEAQTKMAYDAACLKVKSMLALVGMYRPE